MRKDYCIKLSCISHSLPHVMVFLHHRYHFHLMVANRASKIVLQKAFLLQPFNQPQCLMFSLFSFYSGTQLLSQRHSSMENLRIIYFIILKQIKSLDTNKEQTSTE